MDKISFYMVSANDKRDILQEASSRTRMPSHAVEKDWWVVQALDMIFSLPIAHHLVFKGGTSLSKGWKLIERFSEDIDLAIDRKYFGLDGKLTRKDINRLRRAAGDFVEKEFFESLRNKVTENRFDDVKLEIEGGERTDRDRIILLHYPHVIESPGYLPPRIKIELSCRSLMEPASTQYISSIVDEVFPDTGFTEPSTKVMTVNPERTLLEKIFLLHEEFQKSPDRIRKGDRLSRHLYDVVKLSATRFADTALSDQDLYRNIIAHREQFNAIPGVDYTGHVPHRINIIPTGAVLPDWKEDYQTMIEEMIYEERPPDFDELIGLLRHFNERVNKITWDS